MQTRLAGGLALIGLVVLAPAGASAISGVLCVKTTGKGAVKVRNPVCKTSEVQVGSFDTDTPQASLTDVSVQVRLTADVAIPHNTSTRVSFGPGSESFDTHNMHDEVVNPARLTAPVAGKYFVYGSVLWDFGGAGSYRATRLLVNGAIALVSSFPPSITNVGGSIATHVELAAGDYVELDVGQDSGGPFDLLFPFTELGMAKVP